MTPEVQISATVETEQSLLATIRKCVLGVLLLAIFGTALELLVTGHTEDTAQWIPLVLMTAALLALIWRAAGGAHACLRFLQVTMVLFIASGFLGLYLHGIAKIQFKQETNTSLTGFNLFVEAMKSQSPPALAPGVLIQLGLLGLIYTYRHPALRKQ